MNRQRDRAWVERWVGGISQAAWLESPSCCRTCALPNYSSFLSSHILAGTHTGVPRPPRWRVYQHHGPESWVSPLCSLSVLSSEAYPHQGFGRLLCILQPQGIEVQGPGRLERGAQLRSWEDQAATPRGSRWCHVGGGGHHGGPRWPKSIWSI